MSQADIIEFEHITLEDGLSNLRVEAIEQDFMGYIWIGTKRGLCCYNGYEFEVYKSSAFDTSSLEYHQITCLFEDRGHDLWIGTWSGGLHLYNRNADNMQRMSFAPGNITGISQDSAGSIWIGTDQALYRYDKLNERSRKYHFQSPDRSVVRGVLEILQSSGETYVNIEKVGIFRYNPLKDDFEPVLSLDACEVYGISEISEVFEYNDHTFWLGTDQGLFSYSPGIMEAPQRMLDEHGEGIHQRIGFIVNESYRQIWIGADGLYKYDIVENTISHSKHHQNENSSLSNDYVTCAYVDRQGNIWIGTYASGINIIWNSSLNFHKNSQINQQLDLLSRNIAAITRDNDRNLWLGSWDKGVIVFNEWQEQIRDISTVYPSLQILNTENVTSILRGPGEQIWIGSSSGLLTCIDLMRRKDRSFLLPLQDGPPQKELCITSMIIESDSLMWIGTNLRGMFLLNLHADEFLPFGDQQLMEHKNIRDIEQDREGNIWIATYETGLFRMDTERNIRPFVFEGINKEGTRPASFITIYEDKLDNLWFGTEFHGLIKLSANNQSTIFPISGDLKNNEITSITRDRMGRLWLATSEGLLRFEESDASLKKYYWRDGLVSDEFNYNASFESSDNLIYLGGTNGLVYFNPTMLRDNLYVPPVYIESFYIGNQEVDVHSPGSPLKRPINLTESITLKYSQNEIGFEFVALNYLSSGKNQYQYMLEGFDESGWNDLGTRRRISFTNLDFGTYTLRVKASNNDKVWNEEGASLEIRILPPPWRTWWAYTGYMILLLAFVFMAYRLAIQRVGLQQQIVKQRLEKEQQAELSNMKLRFFTNISHEFKIPLSLIISPLDEIVQNFKGSAETRRKLQLVQNNSIKLLRLIKLLIDFRKAEQDVLKLSSGSHDLILLAREAVQTFESLTIEQNKHIALKTDLTSCVFEFDWNKIDRVLYNLISNALNHTEELSEILVCVSESADGKGVSVAVQDNGVGISAEDLPHIFEKFYQSENSPRNQMSGLGSGIGLFLCREIIGLHGGRIHVESIPGKGSIFTFTLPATTLDTSGDMATSDAPPHDIARGMEILEAMEETNPPNLPEDAPLILLVEDHLELRMHIRRMLANYYRVEEAEDGFTGLEMAKSHLPDLILSDIIMPGMDGVEMCMHVKEDPKTEHIPVILLSAKSDLESKVEGYEKGADDFLEKPFLPRHLLARIRNLIESREKLKAHFGEGVSRKPKMAGIVPVDREFLEKVYYKIEHNTGNSEYNVTELSLELGMSRVHLYRRFKDLTGKTPKDYMKETRLKAAAALLEEKRYTISEVAYRVGFNTPSNFTASFKSFYGISPKEYKSS